MKMRWASQLIVVIGKETHSRDWVNWEIAIFGTYYIVPLLNEISGEYLAKR